MVLALAPQVGGQELADPGPDLLTAVPPEEAWAFEHRLAVDETVVRDRFVRVDAAVLTRASASEGTETIALNLFEDVSMVAVRDRVERRSADRFSWFGRAKGAGSVIFAVEGGAVAGNVRIGRELYQLRPVAGEVHVVRQIDPRAFPAEDPPVRPRLSATGAEAVTVDDGSIIDVMVVYTEDAANASGNIAAEIQLGIDLTNMAYENSLIDQRVRLVHSQQVEYVETGNSTTDITRLQAPSDGYLDEVHPLRDAHGADIVSMWLENIGQTCGRGYVMTDVSPKFQEFAFNIVRRLCATGNFTFGHELGHNMGACHDRGDSNCGEGAYPYSHGYVYVNPPTAWRTIMGVPASCNGCPRIQYFSNPLVDFGSVPTGVPQGSPQSADVATTFDNTAFTVANFRASVPAADVRLVASYKPSAGAPRTETTSESADPPAFGFYYDETLGNYEEQPGGPCSTGQSNPTYLTIRYAGDAMEACSFQGSWDAGAIPCSSGVLDLLNSGAEVTINTDDYLTDPSQCELYFPLQPRIRPGEPHWMHLSAVVGGQTYERRLNFFQNNPTPRVISPATEDAWVLQDQPNANRGASSFLRVRTLVTGWGRNSYLKFVVSGVSGPIQSATLKIRTQDRDVVAAFYRVLTNGWNESTITWNNAPLDAVFLESASVPAESWHDFDVTGEVTGNGTYSFGFTSSMDVGLMDFWSSESSFAPRLEVEFQP